MSHNNNPQHQRTPEELRQLREEIIKVLGYKFKYDSAEFTPSEEIQVYQVRSSVAGHGSSAFHSYMKQSSKEDERQRLMKEEWDNAVYRLEQHKLKIKSDAELATENKNDDKKSNDKRKKAKKNKKNKKSSKGDSDDDDSDNDLGGDLLVSLFGHEALENAGIVPPPPPPQQQQQQLNRTNDNTINTNTMTTTTSTGVPLNLPPPPPPPLPTTSTGSNNEELLSGPIKRRAEEQLVCIVTEEQEDKVVDNEQTSTISSTETTQTDKTDEIK